MSKQWVQHKSGQGGKWELDPRANFPTCWKHITACGEVYYLPKSEYIICDPPEEWEDVTRNFCVDEYIDACKNKMFSLFDARAGKNAMHAANGYRIRKLDGPHNGPCFIVERRKS